MWSDTVDICETQRCGRCALPPRNKFLAVMHIAYASALYTIAQIAVGNQTDSLNSWILNCFFSVWLHTFA
jgi:hypothetical protein